MSNVSENRRIILDDYISRLDDIYVNGKGTHIQFDLKKRNNKYRKTIFSELKKIPHCKKKNKRKKKQKKESSGNKIPQIGGGRV